MAIRDKQSPVMAGLVPVIHVFLNARQKFGNGWDFARP
jgi:hypothetical protein